MDGIILCGGQSRRMKPYIPYNKALVEIIPGVKLLDYQIEWLKRNGVTNIILAIDSESYQTLEKNGEPLLDSVHCSVEKERIGTGGAISKAITKLESHSCYVMNVDDIIISTEYNPLNLIDILTENQDALAAILLAKTRLPFGIVEVTANKIVKFMQKPLLHYNICSGHYSFTLVGIRKYLPLKGNFEDKALPQMANDGVLFYKNLEGEWITVNNVKQLEAAKKRLKNI